MAKTITPRQKKKTVVFKAALAVARKTGKLIKTDLTGGIKTLTYRFPDGRTWLFATGIRFARKRSIE